MQVQEQLDEVQRELLRMADIASEQAERIRELEHATDEHEPSEQWTQDSKHGPEAEAE